MMSENNPWKTKTTKPIYENPWIKVEEHEVINPNGGDGIYGTVHFKNYAIGIIALDEDLNTWIVGQYRYPLNQYSWEIPEGGGPLTKSLLESAKRELLEEVGIKANYWEEIVQLHLSNSVSDEYGVVFLAKDLSYHKAEPEETEDLKIKKLPFKELLQMVLDGEITDSLSVAGVLKLARMLNI